MFMSQTFKVITFLPLEVVMNAFLVSLPVHCYDIGYDCSLLSSGML